VIVLYVAHHKLCDALLYAYDVDVIPAEFDDRLWLHTPVVESGLTARRGACGKAEHCFPDRLQPINWGLLNANKLTEDPTPTTGCR